MLQTKGWRQRGDALPRLMDGRTDKTDGELLDAGATVATTERAADASFQLCRERPSARRSCTVDDLCYKTVQCSMLNGRNTD